MEYEDIDSQLMIYRKEESYRVYRLHMMNDHSSCIIKTEQHCLNLVYKQIKRIYIKKKYQAQNCDQISKHYQTEMVSDK